MRLVPLLLLLGRAVRAQPLASAEQAFDPPIAVSGYTVQTTAASWTLDGSTDGGGTWVPLDAATGTGASFTKNITGVYTNIRLTCPAAPCDVSALSFDGIVGTPSYPGAIKGLRSARFGIVAQHPHPLFPPSQTHRRAPPLP